MYTADSAIGVRFGVGKRWEVIPLANFTIAQLISTFRRAQLKLFLPSAPTVPLYLDFDYIRRTFPTFVGTVADLLTALGNASLPTTPTGIVLNLRTAQYKDGHKAGYTVTAVTHANLDNPSIADEDKTDIRLTRLNPATDYTEFYKRYLVSINGFYHQTDTDGVKGIVVTDAMKTLRHSGQNQIGLYNFKAMGDLVQVPITDAMMQLEDDGAEPGEARINLNMDLTGKTVFLVLGGYFMTIDPRTFTRVGDSSYLLDFKNIGMKNRWFESSKYLDLKHLPVDTTPINDDQILAANLTSAVFLRAYLKLTQTFFVILDNPEVFIEKQFIKRTRLPDIYVAYKEPKWPMVTTYGRHPEYWSTKEDGQWSMTVYDNVVAQRIYNTVNANNLTGIDDANEPQNRGELAWAQLLVIGSDV